MENNHRNGPASHTYIYIKTSWGWSCEPLNISAHKLHPNYDLQT